MIPYFDEPHSTEQLTQWVRGQSEAHDLFRGVYLASETHRAQHGCNLYPTSSGPMLGVLAAATGARRILEVGCGLGYSALWMAFGSQPDGIVNTCEKDADHAALAREHIEGRGGAGRITVHPEAALDVLTATDQPYDMAFLDGDPEEYPGLFDELMRLVRPGALIVSSNLFLGLHGVEDLVLQKGARYRESLLNDNRLRTAFTSSGLALSVRT